jgi:hypothetical protein
MADNGRVIVGCTHGAEDPDRVGRRLPDRGRRARPGQAGRDVAHRGGRSPGPPRLRRSHPRRTGAPVERVHAQFIEKGGRFYVCPICFNERDLDQTDLVDKAELHGATPLMEFAGGGAITFSY